MTFLKFIETPNPGKVTKVWDVNSAINGIFLGRVGYMPTWRKYTFAPVANTIFDSKCLQEITEFLIIHKDDRQ